MILETTIKWNGSEFEAISVPQVKQIAGRAGRYKVAVSRHNTQADETLAPQLNGPSFRRGAVTWASQVGMTEAEIQTLGRWRRSNAYKEYIEYTSQERISLSQRFQDNGIVARVLL